MHKPIVRMMLSGGCFQLMKALCERVEYDVHFIRGASVGTAKGALPQRLAAGESADVIVFAEDALPQIQQYLSDVSGMRLLANSSIGIGVASPTLCAAPRNLEDVIAILQKFDRFAYSSSVSGQHLMKKLEELEVGPDILRKGLESANGPVGKLLLNGDAPIGFQQVSELIEISGVTVLGEVPDELQKKTGYYICSLRTAATGVDANRFINAVIEARTTNILRALGLSLDEKI